MLIHDENIRRHLTSAQAETLNTIDSFETYEEAAVEYGPCDVHPHGRGYPDDMLIIAQYGIERDNEQIMWVMEPNGDLTLQ